MERLLTLSRAARLVGVSRSALQKKIHDGELHSFEGLINLDDLTRIYPQADVEDKAMLDKIEQIIDNALKRARGEKLRQLLTPDINTLAARVANLSKELTRIRAAAKHYEQVVYQTKTKLTELEQTDNPKTALQSLTSWLDNEIKMTTYDEEPDRLLTQDTLLRMVAAHVHLMPSEHEFFVEGNNSILDAALSTGLALDYGCSNGNCGKCKARVISGEVRITRKHDFVITEAEKTQGYILTCSNTAVTDVVLTADEAQDENDIPPQSIKARIKKIDHITPDLLILHLKTPRTQRLRFLAGQRAKLNINGENVHDYPIASCPCDDRNLQFHICRNAKTAFTNHVFDSLKPSDSISIEGPEGHFVLQEELTQPIIFLAFDTGFAPIKSLIEHAMTLEVVEFIHLYWIASSDSGHYQHNICRAWTDAFDNFKYTPLSTNDASSQEPLTLQLNQIIQLYPDLKEMQVYTAGPEQYVTIAGDFFLQHKLPDNKLFMENV